MDKKISTPQKNPSISWLTKMAWRDSRRSRSKLFLFTTSIVIGIAAFVAINSFKLNLESEIEVKAKSLLGADLEVYTNHPWKPEQIQFLDSISTERSWQIRFASMIYFPRTYGTRLVQVRALSGLYPYYGAIETEPAWAAGDLQNGQFALVDERLMLQFDVEIGDEIKVGNLTFEIKGKLRGVPGQSGITMTVSPAVYIPGRYIYETGLVQKGSRVTYSQYFEIPDQAYLSDFLTKTEERFTELELRYQTVEKKKNDTSKAFENLAIFLNLAAFIALLLGSIGVSSAVFIYLKGKKNSVAILRCMGLKGKHAFIIYIIQVMFMGFVGAVIGSSLGILLQYYLPLILKDALPFSITPIIYWHIPFYGLILGLLVTLLFALVPLISLSKVSPLHSIREAFETNKKWKIAPVQYVIYTFMVGLLYGFAFFQVNDWMQALFFCGGLAIAFLLLLLIAKGLMFIAKTVSRKGKNFLFKQGVSNLYRPNNQTSILILTVGLCSTLLATIFFLRLILVNQIKIADAGDRPNMVLFDIQSHQKEELTAMTLDYDLPVIQDVPVVTMRLKEINGITKKKAKEDSTLGYKEWTYNREYRITFRDSLIASETLEEGKIQRNYLAGDSIMITVSKGFAESVNWNIGDEVLWNVQGALLKTYIGGYRKIDWRRVQTNFIVLFPKGVLEDAPQFHILVTKVDESAVSARYQQAVVRLFPNVSIIDLELILKTLEDVLNQISFVINFMALLSVITGIIVLAGSIVISKGQRVKESVLLRTLGAKSKQVLVINIIEYAILGGIAALSGVILANIFSFLLSKYMLEADFIFDLQYSLGIILTIILTTILLGISSIRPILRKSPLEILRKEN
ncbi:MAG: FtsX-like permease family protein [Reichenbachiella sp.]